MQILAQILVNFMKGFAFELEDRTCQIYTFQATLFWQTLTLYIPKCIVRMMGKKKHYTE